VSWSLDTKDARNRVKHGVSFIDAQALFWTRVA
jgi:uncharacterized DUF497 family protein